MFIGNLFRRIFPPKIECALLGMGFFGENLKTEN
jgi:hypothetical protein